MIEEVFLWQVICEPWDRTYPIKSILMYVQASSRKEAELIVLKEAHKFFDQDMHYYWNEPVKGYRQV